MRGGGGGGGCIAHSSSHFWYWVVSEAKLFSQEGANASRCHFDQFLAHVKFSSFVYLRVVVVVRYNELQVL